MVLIKGSVVVGGAEGKLLPMELELLVPLNPVPWGEWSSLVKGPALQTAGLRGTVRKARIAPPALGVSRDHVICAMCPRC